MNVDTKGGWEHYVVREMQMKQSCDNIDEVYSYTMGWFALNSEMKLAICEINEL